MSPRAGQESGIFAIWEARECGFCVEYDPGVLDAIAAAAAGESGAGSQAAQEAGGILYGLQTGTGVRVHAMRPFMPQQKFGPPFRLSETDNREFTVMLLDSGTDPDLAALEPVGWWIGHKRAGGAAGAEREGLAAPYWHITLVIRGNTTAAAGEDFFVRHADGAVSRQPGSSGIVVSGPGVPQLNGVQTAPAELVIAATPDSPVATQLEHTAASPAPGASARESRTAERPFRRAKALRAARFLKVGPRATGIAVAAILLAVSASVLFRQAPPPPELGLALDDQAGQLTISWNPAALPGTGRAALTIREPDKDLTLPLTERELKAGRVVYSRTSPDVTVRFQFEAGDTVRQEFVRFVGRPLEAPGGSGTATPPDDRKNSALGPGE
jgi:hypothetical protein